nr:MAG TPA: hypothetical protein [Caudoviricetes sp.]
MKNIIFIITALKGKLLLALRQSRGVLDNIVPLGLV